MKVHILKPHQWSFHYGSGPQASMAEPPSCEMAVSGVDCNDSQNILRQMCLDKLF